MTAKQVANLRVKINAAWDAGDRETADRLQSVLHDHFVREHDAFIESSEGQKYIERLIDAP